MTIKLKSQSKYQIRRTSNFKKNYKKIKRQGKDVEKLKYVVSKLVDGIKLEEKYNDHSLKDTKHFKNCRECHIEPDWLLVYQYRDNELILFLMETGSHSEIFNM